MRRLQECGVVRRTALHGPTPSPREHDAERKCCSERRGSQQNVDHELLMRKAAKCDRSTGA